MRTLRILVLAGALGVAGIGAPTTAVAAPAARTVTSIQSVGPLFFPSLLGLGPALGLPHFCSGSVVHSASRDLVLTAAHCVYGTGVGFEFAPGYHDGVSPYGVWTVTRVYVDPAWTRDQDPQHDVALLRVAPRGGQQIEDRTAAAVLTRAPAAGMPVTVDGYVAGSGGRPITCTAPVYYTSGFPSFDCAGYADGVSGGPWLTGAHAVGVVGGLHQGGCTDSTSYSPAFGADTFALLARAQAGGRGDIAPIPGSDGC
jgi:hypothetical protein